MVEATTGLAETLAGVAADVCLARRLSGREGAAETDEVLGTAGAAWLWGSAVPGEAGTASPAPHHGALPADWPAAGSSPAVDSANEAATRGVRAEGADDVGAAAGCSAAWERWLRRLSV